MSLARIACTRWIAIAAGCGLAIALTANAYATAGNTGYAAWDPASDENSATLATPHKDYATTTVKCRVCHAPHNATGGGEALLPVTIAESCSYCHIETLVGVIAIYDGQPDNYLVESEFNHSASGGAACTVCHSVHGADTYDGILASKILKRLPIQPTFLSFMSSTSNPEDIYDAQPTSTFPPAPYDWQGWDPRWVQVSAFCTGCHPYFAQASEETVTVTRMVVGSTISTATRTFKTHPLKMNWGEGSDENGGFVARGSTLPTTTQVAGLSTDGCQRCHADGLGVDQGPGLVTWSFPHYTPGNARFLLGGDEGGGYDASSVTSATQDATCMLCHRWQDTSGASPATAGVGIGY